jgi:type VI secretion system protein
MPLLLRIAEPSDPNWQQTQGGGRLVEVDAMLRIGRAADNDLVLPDPDRVLSKQHCVIRREEGRYVVLDGSANGTFLNDGADRLVRDHPVPLVAGDAIRLGAYVLTVVSVILPDSGPTEAGIDLLGPVSAAPAPSEPPQQGAAPQDIDAFLDSINGSVGDAAEDILEEHPANAWQAAPTPVAADPDHAAPDEEALPRLRPRKEAIPDHWDPLAEIGAADTRSLNARLASQAAAHRDRNSSAAANPDSASPDLAQAGAVQSGATQTDGDQAGETRPIQSDTVRPAPARSVMASSHGNPKPVMPGVDHDPASESDPLLQSFDTSRVRPAAHPPARPEEGRRAADLMLIACGLDPATFSDAKAAAAAERAGEILRIAVDGLLQILGSRGVAKQEFGMQRTIISPGANNVMKFVNTAEEALRMLLCDDIPGFLAPEEAMRETVSDINAHHFALLSGVRAAFADTLRRLDPGGIEQTLSHHATDAVLPALRKARAWDAFRVKYAELDRSLAGDGHDVFGGEFARAYAAIQAKVTQARAKGCGNAVETPDDGH